MGDEEDRFRCIRVANVIIHQAHVLHHLVPAVLVGEVTALAFGDTVAAMVVTEYGVAAPDGGLRETLVTFDMFTETVQQLDDADRVPGGPPGRSSPAEFM